MPVSYYMCVELKCVLSSHCYSVAYIELPHYFIHKILRIDANDI